MPLKRPAEDLDLDGSSKQARHSDDDNSPYNSSNNSKAASKEEAEAGQPDIVQSTNPDPIYVAPDLEFMASLPKEKPLPDYRVCIFKYICEMGTSLSLTDKEEAKEWLCLLFLLLQEPQRERPAFCWIKAAIQGFLEAEQVDWNFLIKIAQKGNGQEGCFGS